ncbi:MAG: alpha/beta hydrolase [Chloroflexi bacterium]|nr:alpha/beta hydrolase [Chloroflexota bacterium]
MPQRPTPAQLHTLDEEHRRAGDGPSSLPPLWREPFVWAEWVALRASPVYYGVGVSQGHGQPVVVVPGVFGTDAYLTELFHWLARVGYAPQRSGIGVNIGCPDAGTERLERTLERITAATGQAAHVIGHSLGGLQARCIANERPELVDTLIMLGAPIQDHLQAHPTVLRAAQLLAAEHGEDGQGGCFSRASRCPFPARLGRARSPQVRRYSVYSRNDGVVDWRACPEAEAARNVEVTSTHLGLVFHPDVYRLIGRLLAGATGEPVEVSSEGAASDL